MVLSHAAVIDRYIDRKRNYARGSSLHFDGDILTSNFMGDVAVRGDWGCGVDYIINGDRYAFINHNRLAIRFLRAADRNNIVQIPFSALAGAGLVKETSVVEWHRSSRSRGLNKDIRVVATRDDRYWKVCRICGEVVIRQPYGDMIDWKEQDETKRQGKLIDVSWFYDTRQRWSENTLLVETSGPYKFDWVHAKDRSKLCTSQDLPQGHVDDKHELGATVICLGDRYYLSSLDYEDRRRSYFLCQLPNAVSTIEEAYDSLMPVQVSYAKALGRNVLRQGDIFAIETSIKTRDLTRPTQKRMQLHGTTHVATDVRYILGRTYARGTIRHAPQLIDQGRRPQHEMVKLGKTWWEIHKNKAEGSWQLAGRVD
jgi:hypothetical protein